MTFSHPLLQRWRLANDPLLPTHMLRANKFVYEQHVTYIFISIPIGQLWASHNGNKHPLFSLKGQSSRELLRQKTIPVGTTDIGNLVRKSGFTRNLPMNMIRYYLTNNCVPLCIQTGLNHSDATMFLNWKYFLLWSEKCNLHLHIPLVDQLSYLGHHPSNAQRHT